MSRELYIGIMSGTSLDGIDVALVDLALTTPLLLQHSYTPFDSALRSTLFDLAHSDGNATIEASATTSIQLSRLYAEGVFKVLEGAGINVEDINAIGCHGQTILHRPELGFTLQIGNPAWLVELTNISVITDFRNRDIAAGGQGAPLVPAFHQAIFSSPTSNRVIVNIGGIANLTYLPIAGNVIGFDCGPGNVLMDAWARKHINKDYDENGAWANLGSCLNDLLAKFCQEEYFAAPPPKSTGRELFNLDWLNSFDLASYQAVNVQRTLLELTTKGIAEGILRYCEPADEIFLCGGGANNSALHRSLQKHLPNSSIKTTNALGVEVTIVEAMAFAWLAQQTIKNKPSNLPAVTGARHLTVLGAIYPK